ncbi:FHA domain-containing protein [Alkalimarinus coralli]|uniref:FHA domain-containing protein n=1 Tax=Alkalimarinus coralli TaxID=2935863 RepID=UPI00202B7156|nr:FHA domain-containing protein [Alkalimarinus coralli]
MNLYLKPVGELDIEDIHIQDHLFAVGRKEPPFSACGDASVAKLSRKHARIFEENGKVYVVDLGSMNGTKLNGHSVSGEPQTLAHGDRVEFAGMAFTVEIEGQTNEPDEAVNDDIAVVLTPENERDGKPILVTDFPFLVSKSEGVFYDNKARFSSVFKYISRRHAYLFLKEGRIFLEDLNSTNGTFKGDTKLEDEPVELISGDSIAFGNGQLRFNVKLVQPDKQLTDSPSLAAVQSEDKDVTSVHEDQGIAPKDDAESASTSGSISKQSSIANQDAQGDISRSQFSDFDVEPGTILVDKASPFLDIFCAEGQQNEPSEDAENAAESHPAEPASGGEKSTFWCRLSIFFFELTSALKGDGSGGAESSRSKSKKEFVIGLLVISGAAVLITILLTRESAERDIQRLIAEGQFQQAATIANQYLEDNPEDQFVIPLAYEALLRSVIPEWQHLLDEGRFDDSERRLEQAIRDNPHNRYGVQALRLLQLVGDYERFFFSRNGQPLTHMYETEEQISSLISTWDADADKYRQIMNRVSASVDQFKKRHTLFYSQLRALRSEHDLYSGPIRALTQKVTTYLDAADAEKLKTEINRFIEKYPDLGGVAELRSDLNSYLLIKAAADKGDPIALKELADHLGFNTPPFKQKVQSLLVNIPTDEFIQQIRQADKLWADGELSQAIERLQALNDKSETQLVSTLIERYQNILTHWKGMGGEGGNYTQSQLIEIYPLLEKQKDVYLWSLLESQFKLIESTIIEQADKHYELARDNWARYLDNGGIWGALRLETDISSTYRTQAKLLSDAYNEVSKGAALLASMDIPKDQPLAAFEDQVKGEAKRQRKWINDLHLVLDQKIRDEKVSQLPQEGGE